MIVFINIMIHFHLYLRIVMDSKHAIIQVAIHVLKAVLKNIFQILYVPKVRKSSFYLWGSVTIRQVFLSKLGGIGY